MINLIFRKIEVLLIKSSALIINLIGFIAVYPFHKFKRVLSRKELKITLELWIFSPWVATRRLNSLSSAQQPRAGILLRVIAKLALTSSLSHGDESVGSLVFLAGVVSPSEVWSQRPLFLGAGLASPFVTGFSVPSLAFSTSFFRICWEKSINN